MERKCLPTSRDRENKIRLDNANKVHDGCLTPPPRMERATSGLIVPARNRTEKVTPSPETEIERLKSVEATCNSMIRKFHEATDHNLKQEIVTQIGNFLLKHRDTLIGKMIKLMRENGSIGTGMKIQDIRRKSHSKPSDTLFTSNILIDLVGYAESYNIRINQTRANHAKVNLHMLNHREVVFELSQADKLE